MVTFALAASLGLLRFLGHRSEAFQAIAHLFVGGLFGAYFVGRRSLDLWLAVGLSVVELLCFLHTSFAG